VAMNNPKNIPNPNITFVGVNIFAFEETKSNPITFKIKPAYTPTNDANFSSH